MAAARLCEGHFRTARRWEIRPVSFQLPTPGCFPNLGLGTGGVHGNAMARCSLVCRQGYLGSWLRVRRASWHYTSHGCFEGEQRQRSPGCAVGIHNPGKTRPSVPGLDCSDGSGSFTAPGTICSATFWNEGHLMNPGTSRPPEGTELSPTPGEGPGQPSRGADPARRRGIARGQSRGRPGTAQTPGAGGQEAPWPGRAGCHRAGPASPRVHKSAGGPLDDSTAVRRSCVDLLPFFLCSLGTEGDGRRLPEAPQPAALPW